MNILNFTRTMGTGGTEKIIRQLIDVQKHAGFSVYVCSTGGSGVAELSKKEVQHFQIPDIDKKNPKLILQTVCEVVRIINKNHIDIVHTHHRMAAFYIRLLNDLRLIHVIHIHTQHNEFSDKRELTQYSLKHAYVVAVGQTVYNNLINDYHLSTVNIRKIYNSVQIVDTEKDKQLKSDINKFYVLNIGRLSPEKGITYFIEAARIIKNRKIEDIRFSIIGDGTEEEKLRKLIIDLKLEDTVDLLGYRSDIFHLIRQSDLIVLSSLTEGLPLTPIEAFACGKPVVGTDVGGTAEIIQDGVSGFLVPSKDAAALAEKIIKLKNNRSLLTKMGALAKLNYDKNFSYNQFQHKYLQLYQEVASE